MNIKRFVFAASLATSLTVSQTASAAWLYKKVDSDFGDDISIAVTAGPTGGFGLRCQRQQLSALYIVDNPNIPQEAVDKGNPLHVIKMKLRIDKGAVVVLDAFASIDDRGMLTLASTITADQAASIRDAKSKVALAMSVGDENFFEQSVLVEGSTTAIGKVLSQCGA